MIRIFCFFGVVVFVMFVLSFLVCQIKIEKIIMIIEQLQSIDVQNNQSLSSIEMIIMFIMMNNFDILVVQELVDILIFDFGIIYDMVSGQVVENFYEILLGYQGNLICDL